MQRALVLLPFMALAACVTPSTERAATPSLTAALDTQADGFRGVTEAGESFAIVSTSASARELCRVVSIDSANRFEVESFCKAPGGVWR